MSDRDCPDALLMHAGLLPVICGIAEDVFGFQQDDVAAHHARDTVEHLHREML